MQRLPSNQLIVKTILAELFDGPAALLARTPKVKEPLEDGGPVINPVRVLRDSPGGNVPLTIENPVGELVALIV